MVHFRSSFRRTVLGEMIINDSSCPKLLFAVNLVPFQWSRAGELQISPLSTASRCYTPDCCSAGVSLAGGITLLPEILFSQVKRR